MSKISLIPPKMICHTTRISIHNWLWLNFGRKIMDDSSSPRFSGGKNDWMISSSIGVWILSLRYQGGERRRRYKLKTQCTLGLVKLTACDFREWLLIFASLTEIELIFCNANHSTITKCEWVRFCIPESGLPKNPCISFAAVSELTNYVQWRSLALQ